MKYKQIRLAPGLVRTAGWLFLAAGVLCALAWPMACGGAGASSIESRQDNAVAKASAAAFSDPTNADTNLGVLTRIIHVRELSTAEASRGYPVQVSGVITFDDDSLYLHFLQDDSAGIYLDTSSATIKNPLRHGQRVQVNGFSGPGDYAPIIHAETIEVLGQDQLPVAKATTVRMLMTGTEDSQWVALKGVIRSQSFETNRAVMSLSTMDSTIDVVVPASAGPPPAESLVDAAVEVSGVCTTIFNDHRRLQGVILHVPDWSHIETKEAAPSDPFKLPLRPIAELFQFQPGSARLHRVHVQGTVIRRQADGSFYLQEGQDGIYVQGRAPVGVWAVGSAVEAVAFTGLMDKLASLQDALVKPLVQTRPIQARRLNPETALDEERHATLVQIRGRVIGHSARTAEEMVTIQSGQHVFDAVLERVADEAPLTKIAEGSVVDLTGVYMALLDNQRKVRSFQVLLRSPADAKVISSPSWWTVWHTVSVLGALGAVLLIALAWVGLLRLQVQQRTRELRAEIEERKRAEDELKKAQGELLRASRLAGMAEVATSVLHNVGNVLNSVNVSINLVFDQVKGSKVSNLARAANLLRQHSEDLADFIVHDPKGRQLPGYLGQLSEHLAREQALLVSELESLRKNAGHIKDIVATQQSYAKVVGVTETMKVTDLIEDALRVNMEALARHDVQLFREFASNLPAINVDKHKVLQILVNLIRNAKHACDDAGQREKRLTVRVANGEGKLKISVIDNGIGIPSENLTRIFNHGFTTRKNGHGFGLHSGALAAKELGGALLAQSEGPGKGASFTLELPVGKKC